MAETENALGSKREWRVMCCDTAIATDVSEGEARRFAETIARDGVHRPRVESRPLGEWSAS